MARQTIVRLRDDIDGGEAAETVQFTWAGTAYEIDLSKEHADAFAAAIEPYLRAARRVRGGARRGGTTRRAARVAASDVSEVRAWALENGYAVSSRGRLPANIIAAFNAARNSSGSPADGAGSGATARKAAKKSAPRKSARAGAGRKRAAKKAAPRKTAAKKAARGGAAARKSSATARRRG
jgi:hypothetical protein